MAQNPNDPKIVAFYRKQRQQAEASAAQGNQQGARTAGAIYQKRADADRAQSKYGMDDATQAARYQAQSMAPGLAGKVLGAGAQIAADPMASGGGGVAQAAGDIGTAIQHAAPQVAAMLGKLGLAGSARMVMQEAQQVLQRGRQPMGPGPGAGAKAAMGGAEGAGAGAGRKALGGGPRALTGGRAPMKNVTPKTTARSASAGTKSGTKAGTKTASKSTSAPTRTAKAPSGRAVTSDQPKGRVDRLKDVPKTASAGKKVVGRGQKTAPYSERIKKMTTAKDAPAKKVEGAPGKPMAGKNLHKDAASVKPRRTGKLMPGARAKARTSEKSEPANAKMRGNVKATTRTTSRSANGTKSKTSIRIERKGASGKKKARKT